MLDSFSLDKCSAVITGGAGMLGREHAYAIAKSGGYPILWDISDEALEVAKVELLERGVRVGIDRVDTTDKPSVSAAWERAKEMAEDSSVSILINNVAANPKVEGGGKNLDRFEEYRWERWNFELEVGLGSAFLCSQVAGSEMASRGRGVIVNIASDLSVIAPDQRLYRREGLGESEQPVKPVGYSVVKHGLIGLTRYLSTYWADSGVRVNALSPGGVYNGQEDAFVSKVSSLIPMGRMATKEQYHAALIFLCSEASAYMTGQNLVMDGGRSVW